MKDYIYPQQKYCEEVKEEICKYIEEGNTAADSAILSSVSKEIYHLWKKEKLKDGKENPYFHKDFKDAIEVAKIKCKSKNIAIIQKSAEKKNWQAAAWFLERRYREEYALKTINEHTGKDGQAIQFNVIGGGYIPKSIEVISSPNGHYIPEKSEVQNAHLAQKSSENNNGNSRNSQTGND